MSQIAASLLYYAALANEPGMSDADIEFCLRAARTYAAEIIDVASGWSD